MTSNAYRPPYRQGAPPPPQQYHQSQYDQRDYRGGQQERYYDQQDRGGGGFPTRQEHQVYEEQYPSHEQWGGEQYQDTQYQSDYQQEFQQFEPDQRQQRNYWYDDRYRATAQARPSAQPAQVGQSRPGVQGGRERPSVQTNQFSRMASQNDVRQPTARDRILKEPESPKNASWDNPFPTFPSKRKPLESKKIETDEQQKSGVSSLRYSQDYQRPSTSSSGQRAEPSRPHTSHSQRRAEPTYDFSSPPDMPLRKDLPFAPAQPTFSQQSPVEQNSMRPLPRRAMTGPASQPSEYGYGQERYQREHECPPENLVYEDHDSRRHLNGRQQQLQSTNNAMPAFSTYSRDDSGLQRRSSDHDHGDHRWAKPQELDATSYRGVPIINNNLPHRPSLDTFQPDTNDRMNQQAGSLRQRPTQFQAYRKPTYQENDASQLNPQQQSPVTANDLVSPLSQFTFELPGSQPPTQASTVPQPLHDRDHFQESENTSSRREQNQQSHYPARSASRQNDSLPSDGHDYPTNRPQNYQPVRPFRPGLAQIPLNDQQSRGYDDNNYTEERYDTRFVQDTGRGQPSGPLSQAPYQVDVSRQGYDSRLLPRSGNTTALDPRSYPQQSPPRPATAGSGIPMPTYNNSSRTNSDNFQRGKIPNPDSLPAHPAPFRPGLMQSTPQPPPLPPQPQPVPYQAQSVQHRRGPSGSKASLEIESPVTIQELNMLRDDVKNRPNDHALGLRFAKRLVEAAKVLAGENNRADPKQTAKNRERYIFDAHKVVKRLCAAGYPDAMFYLADCYGQGLLGLAPDAKEAFALYQSAAKLGHAQAAYRVAVCCELGAEEGGGTRRDPLKAVHWYRRAASLGDTPAMYKMGMIQLKGLLSQPKSPREAISWLKRAAERADKENPHALHELGLLYENAQPSDVIIRDEKYALQLFQEAADLGYKYSQFRLGSVYEYGLLGLPIDPRMSIAWYSRAAKQGEHQAEFALSGWYLTGSGQQSPGEPILLAQSDTEAYLWARKAASSGLAKAEYAMGYYTEVGIGTTPNIEEAKRWYYRAAAQNHPKARERLEHLKRGGQRMQKTRVSRSNVGKHNEGECSVM